MSQRNAHFGLCLILLASLLLTDCGRETSSNALGVAFVAPASLNLHSTLSSKSINVAVLKHGDRLLVLDVKRRYVKVQTEKGAEGWLDSRQLLSQEEMAQLQKASNQERHLSSEGRAVAFDALNMHIDADRRSPSFAQIAANDSVDVLAHKAVPKTSGTEPLTQPSFTKTPPAATTTTKRNKRSKAQKALSLRPPMPPAPKPPSNWLELSSERIGGETEAAGNNGKQPLKTIVKAAGPPAKPTVFEDWILVRTKDQKVGWVLARNVYMAIPDEVAQYAEGQRISSYFDLGAVEDEEKGTKHNWFWTTSSPGESYDFDRFRVFYWNRHRHRYETSYRQRDLTGYFPVEVEPAEIGAQQRYFSLILQDENNRYWKKRYVFEGSLVRLVGSEPYQLPATSGPTKAAPLETANLEAKRPEPSWLQKQYAKLRGLVRR